MPDKVVPDKLEEVQFLTENFDIPPVRAAELVADGEEAEALAAKALKQEQQSNSLDRVPTPDPDADREHLEPEIGDLEKPIAHNEAAPS